jgi:ubiquinone/menaquinone biosynthesis C-methylase UbiE
MGTEETMARAEFDAYADRYDELLASSIASSGEGHEYFAEYKIRDLAGLWGVSHGTEASPQRILDFGSGTGSSIPHLITYFPKATITGADVSRESLDLARQRWSSAASFVHCSGTQLPFADGHFDLAFAACVFHHIPHDQHAPLLGELRRVVRRGGLLVLYEHNPLNPLVRKTVASCPFDEGAVLIPARTLRQRVASAGFEKVRSAYRVFFPRRFRALRPIERGLVWLPLGAQYYVVGIR